MSSAVVKTALKGASVAIGLAFVGWLLLRPFGLPGGPVPIEWNRETCTRCGMLIGDPRFAAQVQTVDGRIHDFDDPGCLLLWEAENLPETHAVYFHHHREDHWLSREQVGFAVLDQPTPMDYGLGAVVRNAMPSALSSEEALAHVQALPPRDAGR